MLKKFTKKNEGGFTLIELMIVIAIIGILAAIAIPQFSAYRTRAYNAAARSDIKNASTAQEAYFVDEETYCSTTIGNLTGSTYGLYLSENVTVELTTGSVDGYTMRAFHSSGNKTFSIVGPGGSITS